MPLARHTPTPRAQTQMDNQQLLLVDALIERAAERELAQMVQRSLDSPALLCALYNHLCDRALYAPWLEQMLYGVDERFLCRFQDCWFHCFVRTQPGELIAAYEYDYVVRGHHEGGKLRHYSLEFAVGRALNIKYAYNLLGAPRDHCGADLMCEHGGDVRSALRALCGPSLTADLPFPDALLNPPRARAAQWTGFHVAMRRTAFHILCALAANFDCYFSSLYEDGGGGGGGDERDEAAPQSTMARLEAALMAYATQLRTLVWRDAQDALVPFDAMPAYMRGAASHEVKLLAIAFFLPPRAVCDAIDAAARPGFPFLLAGASGARGWRDIVRQSVEREDIGAETSDAAASPFCETLCARAAEEEERDAGAALFSFCYPRTHDAQLAYHKRILALAKVDEEI